MIINLSILVITPDFGLSNSLGKNGLLGTQCGSPAYAAPEVFSKNPYGPSVDIWSMYVLFLINLWFTLIFLLLLTYSICDAFLPNSLEGDAFVYSLNLEKVSFNIVSLLASFDQKCSNIVASVALLAEDQK